MKLSIHNLPIYFFSLRKLIPTNIIESTVIGFTIINDALLRTLHAYIKYKYMYVLKCARIINLFPHIYDRLFHHFSFHSCCSYWILVYFRFVSHFSIFRCVSHFSIFRFAALRFVIFRFASLRFVIFRFVSFRCVSISFRSLVQPVKILVSRKNGHRAHAVPSILFTFVRFVKEHFVVLFADYKVVSFPED